MDLHPENNFRACAELRPLALNAAQIFAASIKTRSLFLLVKFWRESGTNKL